MDEASLTIDRNTPIIPESICFGLSMIEEKLQTKLKNIFILPYCGINEVTRWRKAKGNCWPKIDQRILTDELLAKGEWVVSCSYGVLDDGLWEFAQSRGISKHDVIQHKICSTEKLCELLNEKEIELLCLEVSEKFSGIIKDRKIHGLSFPYWHEGRFCGFCTRVLDKKLCKYAISIPNRFCWGLEYGGDTVYVVEGIFDAIAVKRLGYNAMAMADPQPNYYKMMIANKFKHIYLLLDGDYSGLLGSVKAFVILTQMFNRDPDTITIFWLDGGLDPDIFLKTNSLDFKSKVTFDQAIEILNILGSTISSSLHIR